MSGVMKSNHPLLKIPDYIFVLFPFAILAPLLLALAFALCVYFTQLNLGAFKTGAGAPVIQSTYDRGTTMSSTNLLPP
jgi:hypothetical protein